MASIETEAQRELCKRYGVPHVQIAPHLKVGIARNVREASYTYAPDGNLTSKSDLGALAYNDPAHPHAVTEAGGSRTPPPRSCTATTSLLPSGWSRS